MAAISNDYTNAMQLRARAAVLKERQQLKYAALDCWQAGGASNCPPGITLQRFSFANGRKVSLNGTVLVGSNRTHRGSDFLRRAAQGEAE